MRSHPYNLVCLQLAARMRDSTVVLAAFHSALVVPAGRPSVTRAPVLTLTCSLCFSQPHCGFPYSSSPGFPTFLLWPWTFVSAPASVLPRRCEQAEVLLMGTFPYLLQRPGSSIASTYRKALKSMAESYNYYNLWTCIYELLLKNTMSQCQTITH